MTESEIMYSANIVADMSPSEQSASTKWSLKAKGAGDSWPLFTGDFALLNQVLVDKPSNTPWLLLQFLNSFFRSFGQVIFANNPISGLIIAAGIGIADYKALLAASLASTLSFIFALLSRQDSCAILNGGFGYNPVLHGTVSVSVLPAMFPEIDTSQSKFWLFLMITTIISVYITSALNGLFKHIGRFPIPCFTLPFNLLQFMLIFCLLNNALPSEIVSSHLLQSREEVARLTTTAQNESTPNDTTMLIGTTTEGVHTENQTHSHLHWGNTFAGTIVAVPQVYGLNSIPCGALMYLALFVYSPLMTGFAYLGSLIGTLMGIMFAVEHAEIYAGVWGYNGLLCAAALGGFCFVLNVQSTLIALASVIFTTALQHIMVPLSLQTGLPYLTMPFNLTVILFLFATTEKESQLSRPLNLTFPEQHRHQYENISTGPVRGYLRRSQMSQDKEEI